MGGRVFPPAVRCPCVYVLTLSVVSRVRPTLCKLTILPAGFAISSVSPPLCLQSGDDANPNPEGDLDRRLTLGTPSEIGTDIERPVIIFAPDFISRGA